MKPVKMMLCAFLIAHFTVGCAQQAEPEKRPNILIALSDEYSTKTSK